MTGDHGILFYDNAPISAQIYVLPYPNTVSYNYTDTAVAIYIDTAVAIYIGVRSNCHFISKSDTYIR